MAATPVVSTPTIAASPPALAPAVGAALHVNPDSPASASSSGSPCAFASPVPGQTASVTTKQWVIPPRPRPGRKPATDTPPTKRKAQNRAAQRAFRERRAARVGELEDQLKKVEEDHESHESHLRDQIVELTRQLEKYQQDVSWWKSRCHSLEQELAQEKAAREKSRQQSQSYQPSMSLRTTSVSGSTNQPDVVPISIRRSNKRKITSESTSHNHTTSLHLTSQEPPSSSSTQQVSQAGCDSCSSTSCKCIEDAFHLSKIVEDHPTASSSSSSSRHLQSSGMEAKPRRHQHDSTVKADSEQTEIDFTSRFATSRNVAHEQRAVSSPSGDRCGFCEDGTVCLCAEIAEQHPRLNPLENNRLAPIQHLSQFTPPPSEGDVRAEVTLPPLSQATSSCINGPGTCAQCLADPKSTLFCKSLAASRRLGPGGGCCGGRGATGGCCQGPPTARKDAARVTPASGFSSADNTKPVTLTCADAYATLSRHPEFSRATDEIGSWLPILNTLPRGSSSQDTLASNISNRPAMEVEAASVMGVLRYFDRRFHDK